MNSRRLLIFTACALGGVLALTFVKQQVRVSSPITSRITAPAPPISAAARSLRPNYPYSIIPGGAYSPAELRIVNEKDPLVREHYQDFNVRNARLVVLTEDRFQYVSFKLNAHVFWTRKKLRIPKGEILLTDGYSYARTRCGNRLSNTRQANIAAIDPPERLLSLPPFSPELLREIPPAAAPPAGELAQLFPKLPFTAPRLAPVLPTGADGIMPLRESWPPPTSFAPMIPLTPGYLPSSQSPPPNGPPALNPQPAPPTIAPVPEPGTVYLMLVSLCLSLGALAWMASRRPKKLMAGRFERANRWAI